MGEDSKRQFTLLLQKTKCYSNLWRRALKFLNIRYRIPLLICTSFGSKAQSSAFGTVRLTTCTQTIPNQVVSKTIIGAANGIVDVRAALIPRLTKKAGGDNYGTRVRSVRSLKGWTLHTTFCTNAAVRLHVPPSSPATYPSLLWMPVKSAKRCST